MAPVDNGLPFEVQATMRDIAIAERESASISLARHGKAWQWTPTAGRVACTSLSAWDAIAGGAAGHPDALPAPLCP